MSKDLSFHDYVVHDLLKPIRGISSRAMFGGWGIYQNGLIFGIIVDGELYFKVDDANRPEYEQLDSRPFVYAGKNDRPTTMSYWLVPEEIMENEEKLIEWVGWSVQASERTKKG